jgi:hypothetical protein
LPHTLPNPKIDLCQICQSTPAHILRRARTRSSSTFGS